MPKYSNPTGSEPIAHLRDAAEATLQLDSKDRVAR
jgi:hypothetical protein